MRKLLMLFVLVLLWGCDVESPDNYGYNGDVMSVYSKSYPAVERFGEITKDTNEVFSEWYRIYNENGYLIEELDPYQELNNPLVKYYSYNDDDKVIEVDVFSSNTLYQKGKFKYENHRNLVIENWYNSSGLLEYLIVSELDEISNPVTIKKINPDSSLINLTIKRYNNNNFVNETLIFNSDSILRSKRVYKYDDKNRLTESKRYNGDEELLSVVSYAYNEKDDFIEFIVRDSDGNPTQADQTYEHIYDSNDNWITRITYRDNILSVYTERIFEYYN